MRTPVPWFITGDGSIYGSDGVVVCADCFGIHPHKNGEFIVRPHQNAEFIVRACNSHDALLEAAKHAAMEWRLHGQLYDSCLALEAAIAKADGK